MILYHFILFSFFACLCLGEIVQEPRDFLKEFLSSVPKKTKETFVLNTEQLKKLKTLADTSSDASFTFYFGKDEKDHLKVACTVVPQEGKEGPMTIGVCFESDGIIRSVRVIEYSEERGKPVKELRFLKQFSGKKSSEVFQVGSDIDAVSGATRSSRAVSEAVRKSSFAFNAFVLKKEESRK